MSVIVIGNRNVGKTSMVVALAKGTKNVKVIRPDPQSLIERKSNPDTGDIAGTPKKEEDSLLIRVDLPSGREQDVQVRWIDTPGEAWSKPEWKQKNPKDWQDIIQAMGQSQAVLLLLPPYIYRSRPLELDGDIEPNELDPETWKNQLITWLDLLKKYCPKAQHILIAIHKADLFNNNLNEDEKKWQYNPDKPFRWSEYDNHIRNTYFDLAYDIIREYNAYPPYLSPQFFVTTIHNPNLLELPWIYLGSYFAHV